MPDDGRISPRYAIQQWLDEAHTSTRAAQLHLRALTDKQTVHRPASAKQKKARLIADPPSRLKTHRGNVEDYVLVQHHRASGHRRKRRKTEPRSESMIDEAAVEDLRSAHENPIATPEHRHRRANYKMLANREGPPQPDSVAHVPVSLKSPPIRPYQRRPRHKTREDRYDSKLSKEERKLLSSRNKNPPKAKRRNTKKSGDAIMHDFEARNVAQDRLTLKVSCNLGLFGKGKASSPVRRRPVPDLAFSEPKFLNKQREKPQIGERPMGPEAKRNKDKTLHVDAEISRYFQARNSATLETKSHEALAQISRSTSIPNPRSVLPESVELPGRPFLGFGSCGPNSSSPVRIQRANASGNMYPPAQPHLRSPIRSTSYYTWTPSDLSPNRAHRTPLFTKADTKAVKTTKSTASSQSRTRQLREKTYRDTKDLSRQEQLVTSRNSSIIEHNGEDESRQMLTPYKTAKVEPGTGQVTGNHSVEEATGTQDSPSKFPSRTVYVEVGQQTEPEGVKSPPIQPSGLNDSESHTYTHSNGHQVVTDSARMKIDKFVDSNDELDSLLRACDAPPDPIHKPMACMATVAQGEGLQKQEEILDEGVDSLEENSSDHAQQVLPFSKLKHNNAAPATAPLQDRDETLENSRPSSSKVALGSNSVPNGVRGSAHSSSRGPENFSNRQLSRGTSSGSTSYGYLRLQSAGKFLFGHLASVSQAGTLNPHHIHDPTHQRSLASTLPDIWTAQLRQPRGSEVQQSVRSGPPLISRSDACQYRIPYHNLDLSVGGIESHPYDDNDAMNDEGDGMTSQWLHEYGSATPDLTVWKVNDAYNEVRSTVRSAETYALRASDITKHDRIVDTDMQRFWAPNKLY